MEFLFVALTLGGMYSKCYTNLLVIYNNYLCNLFYIVATIIFSCKYMTDCKYLITLLLF